MEFKFEVVWCWDKVVHEMWCGGFVVWRYGEAETGEGWFDT